MKRTNIFFPESWLIRLRAIAEATGLPVAEHIRRAVDSYIKKFK